MGVSPHGLPPGPGTPSSFGARADTIGKLAEYPADDLHLAEIDLAAAPDRLVA